MDTTIAIKRVADYLGEFLVDPIAFRGQQMRGGGPVAEFERQLAVRCGFPYCVATCNATTALMGVAIMLGLSGRSVWFPKPHWEGSISAMRSMGAKIHRYDPQGIARFRGFTRGDVAIVSQSADVGRVRQRAGDHICIVVEDSSRVPRWTLGFEDHSTADIQVMSFGPGKPLCLAEGGAVLFRSPTFYRRFIRHAMHPERMAAMKGIAPRLPRRGLNARIHPLAAVLGLELLKQMSPVL